MHRISVIIPFYNAAAYMGSCIRALLAQDYPRALYEVILVDNNSTDGSTEIARKFDDIRLLSETKQGAYAARNCGLSEATGEIVAFTDPDCIPRRDWLRNISKAMESDLLKVVVGSRDAANDSSILAMLSAYENTKDEFVFSSLNPAIYYGHTNNMAVRGELFDSIGPFAERRRGADTLFVHAVVKQYSCEAVAFSSGVNVRHLELDSLGVYYHKVSTYGRSRRMYRSIAKVEALTIGQRLGIFRRVASSQNYRFLKSAVLFSLLAIGLAYWMLGGLRARCQLLRNPESGAI